MREILFRGKTPSQDEYCDDVVWVEGFYTRFNGKEHRIYSGYAETDCGDYYPDWCNVRAETVGQYTELTDKNGKKIFEGDIILFEDESPSNYEYHDCTEMRCGEVRFDDGKFYLTNRIAVEMGDLIYDGKLDGVIIGNIHDNPELLKGERKIKYEL